MERIIIKTGDITKEKVCAIVNAANSSLMGGGGVDGAIHREGGIEILEGCKKIRNEEYPDGVPTGEAVATHAGNLPAKYVIHTVGPVYSHCGKKCAELLASCYMRSLQISDGLGCKDVAFPAISTGIYGYPKDKAAWIAYTTVQKFLKDNDHMAVHFVLHNSGDKEVFMKTIEEKC
jgi:O-acetyl-ADP-ribose deacetylase (regulator of RNase III)